MEENDELITTKEIVQILKKNKLMGKAYLIDMFIKYLYSRAPHSPSFKNGIISFTKDNLGRIYNTHPTDKQKKIRVLSIINTNYPSAKKWYDNKY